MGRGFVDSVVNVEHGFDRGAADSLNDGHGLGQRADDIGLAKRKRFDKNRHAVLLRMGGDPGEFFFEYFHGRFAAHTTDRGALFGRAEDHNAVVGIAVAGKVGAKIDEVANIIPGSSAQRKIGRGYVQAARSNQQPVQAHKGQAMIGNDPANLIARGVVQRKRIVS